MLCAWGHFSTALSGGEAQRARSALRVQLFVMQTLVRVRRKQAKTTSLIQTEGTEEQKVTCREILQPQVFCPLETLTAWIF